MTVIVIFPAQAQPRIKVFLSLSIGHFLAKFSQACFKFSFCHLFHYLNTFTIAEQRFK